jgi:hypothetical protein
MNPLQFLKNKVKDVAAAGFNRLPDRGNLFLRYMTGLGDRNLDLDDSTLASIRESTVRLPKEAYARENMREVFGGPWSPDHPMGNTYLEPIPRPWAIEPRSGPVDPYGKGYGANVAHTLGRFNSTVNPERTNINIQDTYDMVNEVEDPDLVSGKFQPRKALDALKLAVQSKNLPDVGRSALYLSPFKPKPFPVNIDIPYSGDINNKEVYR